MVQRELYWQKIRGGTILAVIFIHCQAAVGTSYNSLNGLSYLILRNMVNFPVDMFFFMSGFFMKPIDNISEFYKKRLPKLIVPYLFYTSAYLGMNIALCGNITIKHILFAFLLGTASTPLYYIVVLTYFTLMAPFLLNLVQSKKRALSVIVFLSTPVFISIAYAIRLTGTDVWNYLKYTPVWLSFYYLGMIIKAYKPKFNKKMLWVLLTVAFSFEILSTILLSKISGFNAYTQLRYAGAFYALVIILLAYEYSKDKCNSNKQSWLVRIGDDSYAIYYMHCAFLIVFTKIIKYGDGAVLPVYQLGELVFTVLMCELVIYSIKRIIHNKKVRMIFGV